MTTIIRRPFTDVADARARLGSPVVEITPKPADEA